MVRLWATISRTVRPTLRRATSSTTAVFSAPVARATHSPWGHPRIAESGQRSIRDVGNRSPAGFWLACSRSTAAVTAPHWVWPMTRITLAPATAQPYSRLASTSAQITLPAIRTLKTSPNPRSRINSAGVRRIDATEHHRQRILSLGGGIDLPTQIPSQAVARAKAFVAFLQNLQHLGRGQLILQLPGRVIRELDLVAQLVLAAKTPQADLDAMGRRDLFFEVAEQVEHVGIDIVGMGGVEQDLASPGHLPQNLLQCRPVEEAHLAGKMDVQHVSAKMFLEHAPDWLTQVAAQDERNAHHHPNQNPLEQIGEDDR